MSWEKKVRRKREGGRGAKDIRRKGRRKQFFPTFEENIPSLGSLLLFS
jgi:hypothetical protein